MIHLFAGYKKYVVYFCIIIIIIILFSTNSLKAQQCDNYVDMAVDELTSDTPNYNEAGRLYYLAGK